MANLRANRITSTEVFETTGSVQFDGSGDYLSLSDSEDFNFGSGNFTIEGWIYLIGNGTAFILGQSDSGGANSTCTATVLINSSNVLIGRVFEGSTDYGITHSVVEKNIWNHFALVRSGSTLFLYLNGVSIQTSIGSITLNNSSNEFSIGRLGQYNTQYFNGHISNLRILKGTALYTENFTPPTRELEIIPNTVLLACQSTTNAAEEKTGKTITVNGNAVANELTPGLLTNVVKSGGSSAITGSVEFGLNDYLTLTSSSDFNLGIGDFTIEGWINPKTFTGYGNFPSIFQIDDTNGSSKLYINFRVGSTLGLTDATIVYATSPTFSLGDWQHFAVVRKSGSVTLYTNGIGGNPGGCTSNFGASNTKIYISTGNLLNADGKYTGFISNLRVIKGTALYTSNFIPPTRKLTKLPGTVLLCCQDSNNPTQEATGKTLTPYGSLIYNPPELVTDGGFSSASNWASRGADWTISGGVATINSANSGYDFLGILTSSTRNGELYELKFDISNWTAGRLELSQSDSSNIGVTVSGSGSYTFRFRYTGTTNGNIGLYSYTDTTASFNLDNVSLKVVPSVPKPSFVPQIGSDGSVVFDGTTKINTPNYFYLPTGPTEQREPINNNYGARGILGGGYNGSVWINSLQYVTIATTGNALDFGDLSSERPYVDAVSSSTRGVFGGGEGNNTMDYITISSTGNAADFGDSTSARRDYAGCSNSTRGLFGGGQGTNIIDYITIASIGNAVDFGDLSSVRYFLGACASPVRGLFAGGDSGAPFALRGIDYVTIASAGNSQTFGGLTNSRSTIRGCSNSIRGVFSGGYTLPGSSNTIDYVNISSTGTATDFGDMTTARGITSAFSSSLRGLFTNWTPSTGVSAIDYINITSTSNALDFGDTITQVQGGCSNGHGGLG